MTMATKTETQAFETTYRRAVEAGRAAAAAAEGEQATYAVMAGGARVGTLHGLCGFGWVVVKHRKFGFWLKKEGLGRTGYGGGVHIWISDYGQSHDMKAAHARAMAKVFEAAGFSAYADSRLD
jgi:hypothetical protein